MASTSEQPRRTAVYRLVVAEDAYLIREGIRSALEREGEEVEVLEYCPDLGSLLRAVERAPAQCRDHGHPDAPDQRRRGHPGRRGPAREPSRDRRRRDQPVRQPALRAQALRARLGRTRLPAEGARRTPHPADGGDPRGCGRRLGRRPQGRGRARRGEDAREELACSRGSRRGSERCSPASPPGASNAAIADSLFLTKRAVEKNINSLFAKLDLTDDKTTSRRVRAALLFLADSDLESGSEVGPEL